MKTGTHTQVPVPMTNSETVTWPIYPLGEMVVGLLKSSIMVRIYS
jgi:hypothetical protein